MRSAGGSSFVLQVIRTLADGWRPGTLLAYECASVARTPPTDASARATQLVAPDKSIAPGRRFSLRRRDEATRDEATADPTCDHGWPALLRLQRGSVRGRSTSRRRRRI